MKANKVIIYNANWTIQNNKYGAKWTIKEKGSIDW